MSDGHAHAAAGSLEPGDHGDHAAHVKKQVKVYMVVFAALAVLTVVTVAVSLLHLPFHLALLVALVVAAVKGGLVACYFMHLIDERKAIYAILILTVFFFVLLIFLPLFGHWDPIEYQPRPG